MSFFFFVFQATCPIESNEPNASKTGSSGGCCLKSWWPLYHNVIICCVMESVLCPVCVYVLHCVCVCVCLLHCVSIVTSVPDVSEFTEWDATLLQSSIASGSVDAIIPRDPTLWRKRGRGRSIVTPAPRTCMENTLCVHKLTRWRNYDCNRQWRVVFTASALWLTAVGFQRISNQQCKYVLCFVSYTKCCTKTCIYLSVW